MKYPVPPLVPESIRLKMARYGALRLVRDGEWLLLEADDPDDLDEIRHLRPVQDLLADDRGGTALRVHPRRRGELKQALDEYMDSLRRTPSWSRLVVKYFGESALDVLKKARGE